MNHLQKADLVYIILISIMYTAVPSIMLSNVFFFHAKEHAVAAPAITAGRKPPIDEKDISLRQYTTSIPIIAAGKTFPRYVIIPGVFLPFEKITKGANRIPIVTSAIIATAHIAVSLVI